MIREALLTWQYQDTESGLIMPYYTIPCLEWLKKQDVSKWDVFEYGAGYSTIWWRANCKEVRSFDHSKVWAKAMDAICETRKHLFISAIDPALVLYDCVIVDSEYWREECVDFCLPYIKPGGYLIIDNWGQENFPNTQKYLDVLKDWEVQIFKQPNHSEWCTAVFKKPL